MRKFLLLFAMLGSSAFTFAQIDSAFIAKIKSLDTADVLKIDTAAVPNDRFTQKIKQLRKERSGLTLETIINLKISEEQAKDTTHSKEFYKQLIEEITNGKTGKLLQNSLINLYRRSFTEQEIDDLIRFYKTSAGKKMDKEFFVLLIESAKDAEYLLKIAMAKVANIQKNKPDHLIK